VKRIRRVLVANRSEIACRLIRGIRESGREAATVYSEPDAGSLHVRLADAAFPLSGSTARETYLDGEKIIAAAKALGCDALHPGYGFLSERAEFNEACRRTGIVFIGPSPEAQAHMGVKTSARVTAERARVPIVPGTPPLEGAQGLAAGKALGVPLLVKAAAGGGGKGMRAVRRLDELEEAIEGCRRDALATAGDARVYVERLVERPRHVEIQVLGDAHGNVVYLGERECSIQRRHQKVIEETPCVALSERLRREMGEAAVALAREVGYENAGTVEFLLDPEGKFYFLEMNTRLQVEHPVTELVTGIDIVQEQLRIAEGEKIHFTQADIRPRGHAIEGRVYAEDPARGFLPGAGRLAAWEAPSGPGVRVDSGVTAGSSVPHYYDPILAKLVVWAETRERAIARFLEALRGFTALGVPTTIPFLRLAVAHPAFAEGDLSTDFIDRKMGGLDAVAKLCVGEQPPLEDAVVAAVAARLLGSLQSNGGSRARTVSGPGGEVGSPWTRGDAFRVAPLERARGEP
jgi:acetyl-CoA carboxylase biotin carboxylase subunit